MGSVGKTAARRFGTVGAAVIVLLGAAELSAAASTSSVPSGSSGSSAPLGVHAEAACDWKPSSPVYWPQQHFTANGVNIRTGPDPSCTSVGLGYSGQQITVYCYSGSWVYLYDDASRKSGWSEVQYTDWDPEDLEPC